MKSLIDLTVEYGRIQAHKNRLSEPTQKKYGYMLQNLIAFLAEEKLKQITPDQVKLPLAEKYRLWLYANTKCGQEHCARHLQMLVRTIEYAVSIDLIEKNALAKLECPRGKSKPVIALDAIELNKLANYRFVSLTIEIARDLFLFQAYTGLSYEGVYNHKIRDLACPKTGKPVKWITGERKKATTNEQIYWVPLFVEAENILIKYKWALPLITNAAYNRLLKEIAAICGINQHLTTHVARKTFATLKRQEGWSSESVKDMLGHASLKTTEQYYFKAGRATVENEFLRLSSV